MKGAGRKITHITLKGVGLQNCSPHWYRGVTKNHRCIPSADLGCPPSHRNWPLPSWNLVEVIYNKIALVDHLKHIWSPRKVAELLPWALGISSQSLHHDWYCILKIHMRTFTFKKKWLSLALIVDAPNKSWILPFFLYVHKPLLCVFSFI